MKKFILLSLIAFPLVVNAQKTVKISGKIMQTTVHQGGVQQNFDPISYAYPNLNMNLLRFNEGDSVPEVVKTFSTDSEGNFSLKVTPGVYGFAAVGDSLLAMQYLPTPFYFMGDMMSSSSTTWTLSMNEQMAYGPIKVSDLSLEGIVITCNNYSSCGMCP